MMKFSIGERFIGEVTEVLGLDPDELPITDITISANIQNVPTVTITMLIQEEQAREIVKLVQQHRLVRPSDELIEEPR